MPTPKQDPHNPHCLQCGCEIQDRYANAKFCSHPCRMKAYRRRVGLNPRKPTPGTCKSCGKRVDARNKLARGRCKTCYAREVLYPQNRKKIRAYHNARRRHIKRATPAWANMDAIDEIYRQCPEGHHVDHVIPLRGKRISGLHVPGNLQHLPGLENQKKSNRISLMTA